ncbi:MAG: hypothetical protein AAF420_13040 [Pseudomonadota bacterium]
MIRIALIGDRREEVTAHRAIPQALSIAANELGVEIKPVWLGTDSIAIPTDTDLSHFDAIWCVPASPYIGKLAAIDAIRYARENAVPFLGTCGGYQHALLEFARNALGHTEADNIEDNPETNFPLVAAMTCPLREVPGDIELLPDTRIAAFYGRRAITEEYNCGFGFNPAYRDLFTDSALVVSAQDAEGDPRAIEVNDHPFFIGVAFQPERRALKGEVHPLTVAFVKAAVVKAH